MADAESQPSDPDDHEHHGGYFVAVAQSVALRRVRAAIVVR
jgi:hypothetical protein